MTGWLTHALATITESRCPNHGVRLAGRFCFACECRYDITDDGRTVVATYVPTTAEAPWVPPGRRGLPPGAETARAGADMPKVSGCPAEVNGGISRARPGPADGPHQLAEAAEMPTPGSRW